MSGVVRDWRFELIEAHAGLFGSVDDPPRAQGWPEVGEGWRDLLDRMCVRIRAAVQAGDATFKFSQIKEKYGTLRVYWDGTLSSSANARVEEAIALAEARSACTCEVCGDEGRLYEAGYVLMTRCTAHAQGRPVESRPGGDNIYIVHRLADRRIRSVQCRRYDRETDSFLDVDPRDLGVEEE